MAPTAGKLLAAVTEGGRHHELVDSALRGLDRVLEQQKEDFRGRFGKESPWWVPGAVDDKITRRIVGALENTLKDVNENPDHPLRLRFDTAIDEFIVKLQASPEVILKAEKIKEEVLNAEAVKQLSGAIWRRAWFQF